MDSNRICEKKTKEKDLMLNVCRLVDLFFFYVICTFQTSDRYYTCLCTCWILSVHAKRTPYKSFNSFSVAKSEWKTTMKFLQCRWNVRFCFTWHISRHSSADKLDFCIFLFVAKCCLFLHPIMRHEHMKCVSSLLSSSSFSASFFQEKKNKIK